MITDLARGFPPPGGDPVGLPTAAHAVPPGAARPTGEVLDGPAGYLRVLASDLDGTLTTEGPVSSDVLDAFDQARAGGLLIVLVTGRRLAELDADHPGLRRHVDAVVAENGAVLVGPDGVRLLAPPAATELTDALAARGIPHHVGEVVVECDGRDAHRILNVLHQTGLDHQIVRNRDALMLLPPAVTKGSGLLRALTEFGFSGHNTVGVGDAQNDHTLLDACEVAVAVANATPALRARADVVLHKPAGEGVVELLQGPLLAAPATPSSPRWQLTLGHSSDGLPVQLPASPSTILVTGASGSGKSFLTGLIVERLTDLGYSCLVLDPEGDHAGLRRLEGVVTVGGDGHLPPPEMFSDLFGHPPRTVVLDLSQQEPADPTPLRAEGLAAQLRDYLIALADVIQRSRRQAGRPHWLVVDEADSFFAAAAPLLPVLTPGWGLCLATYRPDRLAAAANEAIRWIVRMDRHPVGAGVLLANPSGSSRMFSAGPRRCPHVRHQHKYAEGQVLPERRFVFRDEHGPVGADAGNVGQLATALRHATPAVIAHHTRHADFSRWINDVLGDAALADLVRDREHTIAGGADSDTNRGTLVALLEDRYLPTERPGGAPG